MNVKYMHTLNGKPAFYVPGEQICFATKRRREAVQLVDSLKQIRANELASNRWRKKQKLEPSGFKAGWLPVIAT